MNIFLGKRELVVLIIVLILFCLYFIIEFVLDKYNKHKTDKLVVEAFQSSMMNQARLDEIKSSNQKLFDQIHNINKSEKDFIRAENDISRRFVLKKVNLDQVIGKIRIMPDGKKNIDTSGKFDTMMMEYDKHLNDMISSMESVDNIFNMLNTNPKSKDIYLGLQEIYQLSLEIYKDKQSYILKSSDNYINIGKIIKALQKYYNDPSKDIGELLEIINPLRGSIEKSNQLFKENINKIDKECKKILEFMEKDVTIDREIKPQLTKFIQNKLDIFRKHIVRNIGFNLPDIIVTLIVLLPGETYKTERDVAAAHRKDSVKFTGSRKDGVTMFQKEKEKALVKSNGIARELSNLIEAEESMLGDIKLFFEKKASFIVDNNEFKYFNNVDKDNNSLIHFCKKIRKMDRPDNQNMMFKRLSREFIKKKNEQINMLSTKINDIVGDMQKHDIEGDHLNKLRTSEDAQLQMNAINRAKENIDNMGKFKINIK